MDASQPVPIFSNPLALTLFAVAVGAFLFGIASLIRAWRIAAKHPPFAALGVRGWMMGYAALPYLPDAAIVQMKRHYFSVLVTGACLIALAAVLWIGRAG